MALSWAGALAARPARRTTATRAAFVSIRPQIALRVTLSAPEADRFSYDRALFAAKRSTMTIQTESA